MKAKEHQITLQMSPQILAVCRLSPDSTLPNWISLDSNKFTSITLTKDELSIVCDQKLVPDHVKAEKNWRMLKIKGQLDFALVGILKRVISPLSENGISIYAISTYDTDYILIQEKQFAKAVEILQLSFEVEYLV
jgi:uncharacterized protein